MNHFALNGVISPQELYYYALRAVAMLIVIPFHESAHALISWKLGDSTAKDMGRLSMNPLRHFDPLGALCMIAAGVGWAKPVGINPTRFKNPKRGMAVSAAAGPLSNFLLAYAAMLLYKVVYYACGGAAPQLVLDFLYVLISMNISLGVFNLIPVPPFDGSRIVLLFLPQKLYFQAMRYEKIYHGRCAASGVLWPAQHPAQSLRKRGVAFAAEPDRLCGTAVRHCLMAHLDLSKERYPLFYGNTYL